jgi:CelD/BcsL family acetyltransferase involved in cellulose biosynthesis
MKIAICESYDLSELAASWQDLEARAAGGFFLSWRWIGTWLRTTGVRPLWVTAIQENTIVAMGLLVPHRKRRHWISVNQLCLHETGLAEFDALTIEHNGFLIARSAAPELIVEIMLALKSAAIPWDEITLGGVPPSVAAAARAAGLLVQPDRDSPNYGVDLSPDPATGGWQSKLSENQRTQIRQSRSFAERMGAVALQPATSPQQALDFFEDMMVLHTAYWEKRSKPGAFATEFARTFHRRLIAAEDDRARVELLALTAGTQIMGYLYNFQYDGRVCNYQSGFSYSGDNRHRPGLLAHVLAIERAIGQAMQVYDFLAGDAHYKARLGRLIGTIAWCRAQRSRPLLRAELAAGKLYRGIRGLRG